MPYSRLANPSATIAVLERHGLRTRKALGQHFLIDDNIVGRIVREADCGILVDVTAPQAIADAMLDLLRDPGKAERLGQNGRRLVEEKYNWQQDEKRLLDAMNRIG